MNRRGIAAAVLLSLAATACGTARASGVLRARDIKGSAEVRGGAGQDWTPLDAGRAIAAGDEIRTAAAGTATLSSDARTFELGPGTWIAVREGGDATIKTGSLLAVSDEAVTVDDGGGVRARGPGAFRLDYGRRVGAYRGSIAVDLPSGRVDLIAPRELTIGLSVPDVRALVVDESDRWDRRYLANAIQIDQALAPYERSFDVNAGVAVPTVEFIGRFVDPGAIGFLAPLLRTRLVRAGSFDVLVTLLVAIEYANVAETPLPQAFGVVLDLRDQGASFGVAAQALNVDPEPLLRRVLLALNPAAPPQKITPIEGPKTPKPRAGGTGSPSPSPTASPRPTTSPRPSSSPTASPSPSPSGSSSPSPSPSPSPTCEIVDQLMGTCTPPPILR